MRNVYLFALVLSELPVEGNYKRRGETDKMSCPCCQNEVVGSFIFNILFRKTLVDFILISAPEIATLLNSWYIYPVTIDLRNLFPSLYWLIGSSTTFVVQIFKKYLWNEFGPLHCLHSFFPLTLFSFLLSHFSFLSYIVC